MTTMKRRVQSLVNSTAAGLHPLDLAAAVALSILAIILTSGALPTGHPHGGIAASIGILAMTVPVVWRRRAPLASAAALAAGSVLNAVAFGHMVRCGAALPAVFLVAFAVGAWCERRRAGVGFVLCAINVATQAVYDPKLGPPVLVLMLPVLGGFVAFGRVVHSRAAAAEFLRRQSVELRHQREQTARVTVMADQARLSEDLDGPLRDRIGRIASAAAAGRDALDTDPEAAKDALVSIEHDGREILRHTREVVAALGEAPIEPQPSLAELSALLARTTTAEAKLTVEGNSRRLPAGMELTAYRIVEHLLTALQDDPGSTIEVRLCFGPDALEMHVSGPPTTDVELAVVLAAARERAAVHSGTLEGRTVGGVCHSTARIPLVSGYA